MFAGVNLTFFPLFLAGLEGQVVDAYKFFDHTGVNAYNLIATIGSFVLALGIVLNLINAVTSLKSGPVALPDQWGGESLEWFAPSPRPRTTSTCFPTCAARHRFVTSVTRSRTRTGVRGSTGRTGQPVSLDAMIGARV